MSCEISYGQELGGQRRMIRENELQDLICVMTESLMREIVRLVCSLASFPQFCLLQVMQVGGLEVQ